MAIKATVAIALLAIPLVLLGFPFFAVSLSLGALAGALSETDDHPAGRIKSMALKVISFGISSLSVELLRPYPILLGLGLALSTIGFLLIGGISERYRGVTFGAVLVGIYAMIGASISPAWYWQPLLLPAGALFYGLLSLGLLLLHPWRLLEEQLARGYAALADYLEIKASLFPSEEKSQGQVRNQLALRNVRLVTALDQCKDVLNSYSDSLKDPSELRPYLQSFMLLQSLHERAASSHERYDLLSQKPENRELLEGISQTLSQLSQASRKLSESLLTGVPYRHPVSLDWIIGVLEKQLQDNQFDQTSPLVLLVNNLARSNQSLRNLSDNLFRDLSPQLARDRRTTVQRIKDQLYWESPRLRHAIRLSLCFLTGFTIFQIFPMPKGEWIILTSLFVCQPSYSSTRRRLFQRILGTLSGVVGGILIVQLLPTIPGQLLFMLVSAFAFFFWLKKNYSVSVIFITTFVLCAFNLVSHQGVALMAPRLIDTLIGSGLAYLSVRLLWPDWQYKRLPSLLSEALAKNAAYFRAILDEYSGTVTGDDLPYRSARREAHRADNALVLAWQDMHLEPSKRQKSRELAFDLTYLNHALLSYLSAFGAHRRPERRPPEEILDFSNSILSALETCQHCLQQPCPSPEEDLRPILNSITEKTQQTNAGLTRLQFTLLYNIADVAEQILTLAGSISEEPLSSAEQNVARR